MIAQLQKQIAELRDRVASLSNVTIEGYNRASGRGGISFSRGLRDTSFKWSEKTVVITVKPNDGDRVLTVREARYKTLPPEPCTGDGESAECSYEWFGPEFEVYPPLGTKAVTFAGDETTDSVDVPPKLTTKFHRCHREHDVWVLEKAAEGGGETDVCLVHAPLVGSTWGSGTRIRIVHVKLDAAGTAYVTAERTTPIPPEAIAPGYSIARCWPGTVESHWQYFQSTIGQQPNYRPSSNAVYLGTEMINGIEYIAPKVPIAAFTPSPGIAAGDC